VYPDVYWEAIDTDREREITDWWDVRPGIMAA
jgi:hypothetical protein